MHSMSELEDRIAALESEVRALKERLDERDSPPTSQTRSGQPQAPEPTPVDHGSKNRQQAGGPDSQRSADEGSTLDGIVDKVGIALLLIGVAFLLKYSYEQGWLTETFRVGLGFATAVALLVTGMAQRKTNERLSAVLLGGSIASFYGSLFAAFQLYSLIPFSVAMAGMVGTTMLGFGLAITQDRASLACIAALGALATPFLLHTGESSVVLLSIYTVIVLLGTSAIYLFKGWDTLLATYGIASLFVVGTAGFAHAEEPTTASTVAYVLLIAVSTFAASFVSAFRAKIQDVEFDEASQFIAVVGLSAVPAYLELVFDSQLSYFIALSALTALTFAIDRVVSRDRTYLVLAILMGVVTLGTLFEIPMIALSLLIFSVGTHLLAGETHASWMRGPGYATLAILGAWAIALLLDPRSVAFPFLNPDGAQLLYSTGAVLVTGLTHAKRDTRWFHYWVATFALLGTVAHQLQGVAGSVGLTTAGWGVIGLAALIPGFVRDLSRLKLLGLVVVVLTAGKLIFFDLDSASTFVRVLFFMAFGALLLVISSLIPRWRSDDHSAGAHSGAESPVSSDASADGETSGARDGSLEPASGASDSEAAPASGLQESETDSGGGAGGAGSP